MSISIVLMAYNEAENLEPVFREIYASASQLKGHYEILIVDDGSSDETLEIAGRLAAEYYEVRVIRHSVNLGLGGVYRTGFANAKNEAVTFFPADGQYPASILVDFAELIQSYDMVLGYLPNRKGPMIGRILSWIEKLIYRLLFGKLPRFQGILMFRRSLLDRYELRSFGRGWAVLLELILRAARGNCRMVSVPIKVRPRLFGLSKVNNLPTIWANFRQALALQKFL